MGVTRNLGRTALCLLALALAAGQARAFLATETFGNEALPDANYRDWPNVMAVINHSSRVYSCWVNGNEGFYFHGDTDALNTALKDFSAVKAPVLEVVVRPGPGRARSLSRDRELQFDWELRLLTGIARGVSGLEHGAAIWSPHPVLTIRTGGAIDLARLRIPAGVRLVSIADLKGRARTALAKSTDKTVRGWGCGELAALDPYDAESRAVIADKLKDADSWVRLNAVHTLAFLGRKAIPEVAALRVALETADEKLAVEIRQAIETIEKAPETGAEERAFQVQSARIAAFIAAQKQATQ